MNNRILELKDVIGYIPYGLYVKYTDGDISLLDFNTPPSIFGSFVPILRPITDMVKCITHNGEKIVPIVECAKIAFPDYKWSHDDGSKYAFQIETTNDFIFYYDASEGCFKAVYRQIDAFEGHFNQWKLFDYLNSLNIDCRGLIGDLAMSVYDLYEKPYEE